jgi:hypothetical protein
VPACPNLRRSDDANVPFQRALEGRSVADRNRPVLQSWLYQEHSAELNHQTRNAGSFLKTSNSGLIQVTQHEHSLLTEVMQYRIHNMLSTQTVRCYGSRRNAKRSADHADHMVHTLKTTPQRFFFFKSDRVMSYLRATICAQRETGSQKLVCARVHRSLPPKCRDFRSSASMNMFECQSYSRAAMTRRGPEAPES